METPQRDQIQKEAVRRKFNSRIRFNYVVVADVLGLKPKRLDWFEHRILDYKTALGSIHLTWDTDLNWQVTSRFADDPESEIETGTGLPIPDIYEMCSRLIKSPKPAVMKLSRNPLPKAALFPVLGICAITVHVLMIMLGGPSNNSTDLWYRVQTYLAGTNLLDFPSAILGTLMAAPAVSFGFIASFCFWFMRAFGPRVKLSTDLVGWSMSGLQVLGFVSLVIVVGCVWGVSPWLGILVIFICFVVVALDYRIGALRFTIRRWRRQTLRLLEPELEGFESHDSNEDGTPRSVADVAQTQFALTTSLLEKVESERDSSLDNSNFLNNLDQAWIGSIILKADKKMLSSGLYIDDALLERKIERLSKTHSHLYGWKYRLPLVVMGMLGLLLVTTPIPWQPPSCLVADGEKISGFVVSDAPVTFLEDYSRSIRYLSASDVTNLLPGYCR